MLSDNCIAPDTLAQFAARRQQGEPFVFGPELVEQFKARVVALIPLTPDGLPAPLEGVTPAPPAGRSGVE